jgi:hypothetical protein
MGQKTNWPKPIWAQNTKHKHKDAKQTSTTNPHSPRKKKADRHGTQTHGITLLLPSISLATLDFHTPHIAKAKRKRKKKKRSMRLDRTTRDQKWSGLRLLISREATQRNGHFYFYQSCFLFFFFSFHSEKLIQAHSFEEQQYKHEHMKTPSRLAKIQKKMNIFVNVIS